MTPSTLKSIARYFAENPFQDVELLENGNWQPVPQGQETLGDNVVQVITRPNTTEWAEAESDVEPDYLTSDAQPSESGLYHFDDLTVEGKANVIAEMLEHQLA